MEGGYERGGSRQTSEVAGIMQRESQSGDRGEEWSPPLLDPNDSGEKGD